MKSKPTIIFEDNDLIIVNKPAHFLTIPDRFVLEKPNLLTFLKKKYETVFVVHRLDKETSGVICFAILQKMKQHIEILVNNLKKEQSINIILL